jgi:hypothetical protein
MHRQPATRIVDESQVCCTGLPVTRLRDHRRRRIGTYHVAARCCVLRQRRSGAAADIKDGPTPDEVGTAGGLLREVAH